MLLINLVLFSLFIYILIYSIYTLTLNIKAFGAKEYVSDTKMLLQSSSALNTLCVIIWADSTNKRLYDLLKVLDNQTYSRQNYEVHVVFKRDRENVSVPEFAYGAQIHIIENPEYFSKDKSLSLIVQKLVAENRFSAFVFLGADRMVDENYLSYINKVIYPSCVLSGSLSVNCHQDEFLSQIKCQVFRSYLKYQNKVQNIVRTMFEMPIVLDGQNCVIGADVLEKTGRVCFETKNNELKFSLFLASNGIRPTFSPFLNTWVEVDNYNASCPSFMQKLAMFKYYFPRMFVKPWNFKEFVFFMLKPDTLGVMVSYIVLLLCILRYFTPLELKFAFHLGLLLVFNFIIGAFAARLNLKELFYITLYPACIFWQRAKIFMKKISLIWIENKNHEDENVNSAAINSVVFDGKKDELCRLLLVSEDGMRKVVFEHNKRHITSDSFIRMYDAMNDMVNKLKAKGLTLKVCQTCGNFCSVPDGTVDVLKGECRALSPDDTIQQTLIWNSCPNYLNCEIKGIIDNMTHRGE